MDREAATPQMDRAGQTRMRQQMVSWLGDAHAMEMQALQILDNQSWRIESYPDLQKRILEHLEETRSQVERVERCIERYGSMPSGLKDAGAMFIGNMQALGGAFMPDEVVKGSIMSYVFEHLEIACYRSLIGAAEELGDIETAEVCTEILREEEAMADWLEKQLPEVTREFLRRQCAGQHAKR
jgi:ferritin-like metal-binding protein YciE